MRPPCMKDRAGAAQLPRSPDLETDSVARGAGSEEVEQGTRKGVNSETSGKPPAQVIVSRASETV